MRFSHLAIVPVLALATTVGAALAQSGRAVPIQQDLRRYDQVERRLGVRGPNGPDASGPVQSDPTGVAGFFGAPGGYGDSVNSYDPLPQGITGADIR